jgi:hypothetical protein
LHPPRHLGLACALVLLPSLARSQPISSEWVAKWRTDLAFAADSLPAKHPNFFHDVKPAVYRAALDSLSARLPQLQQYEIVVELARIMAMVGDGHTRLTFPFDSKADFFTGHSSTAMPKIPGLVFRHYPIRFGLFADTLWVTQTDAAHRELLGGRVVKLGQSSVAEAIAAIAPTVHRDNDSQLKDLEPTWLVCPEVLKACGVVADMEQASIVVEQGKGHVTATLAPVPPGTAVSWLEARDTAHPPWRDRLPERSHWFTQIQGTKFFYARYREVKDDAQESVAAFADSLFAAIETAQADRLILDLRGNMGGNGFLNRPLVQHLIRAERLWQPAGLWALVDRGTFSAAVMLAADLELKMPTILVGEMTGGRPNSYGDSRKIVLPQTGITVRVSSLYWQLTGPNDKRSGITPHIPVDIRFADWRANRDPVLDVALAPADAAADFAGTWSGDVGWQAERLGLQLDLQRQGAGWTGKIDVPDDGLHDAPLQEAMVQDGILMVSWKSKNGETWILRARRLQNRLVGLLRYKGLDFCAALQPAAPRHDPSR